MQIAPALKQGGHPVVQGSHRVERTRADCRSLLSFVLAFVSRHLRLPSVAQACTAARRPRQRHHHHVYVVKLHDRVWNEPRFRKANPDHQLGKPFVYVSMTWLDPDLRFDKHKAGIQASRFVFEYGLCLLPALYMVYNPMPYQAACEMEVELAVSLRETGYGVWQA